MQENVYGGADEQIGFLYEIYGDKFVMEIFLHGPGGCMSTWDLSKFAYDWWKDKSKKTVFEYSWNLEENWKNNEDYSYVPRNKLINQYSLPGRADFLGDKYWAHGAGTLNMCDYNNCIIFVEHENRVSMHYPDELSCVNYDIEYQLNSKTFYSGVSSEIGNWQHKWYSRSIPLGKFRLHTVLINDKKYIISLEPKTSAEERWKLSGHFEPNWDMYEELRVDWSYRLHIRNQVFINDMIEYTGIDLSYDMNTGNHEQDCSHFKVHDTRIR